jgi:hypothetical protein
VNNRDDVAPDRRDFIKSAGILLAAAACAPGTDAEVRAADTAGGKPGGVKRIAHLDGASLDALGEAMLPSALGMDGQRAAVAAFVAWCDGYDPVAEEMHGYGYADVRYLPPDPVPAWRAQLDGLELLAQRLHGASFASIPADQRRVLVSKATRGARGDRLPSPLNASHVAIALLSHWAASPDAWNLALGVAVSPTTCRQLEKVKDKPSPLKNATVEPRA